jgi:hypothetical protein
VIKKLEIFTNIAVIITAVILCTVLVKKHLLSSKQPPVAVAASPSRLTSAPGINIGKRISIPGIDWNQHKRTLVLALSTTCHFCTESAQLYRQIEQQGLNDVKIVAVFPQPVLEAKAYQKGLGLSFEVVQSSLNTLGVSGTPTLILVGPDGTVQDSWVGKLSDEEGARVLQRLGEAMAE